MLYESIAGLRNVSCLKDLIGRFRQIGAKIKKTLDAQLYIFFQKWAHTSTPGGEPSVEFTDDSFLELMAAYLLLEGGLSISLVL
jgi:hypothetical protein